jgi:uncharacterized membrane protein
MTEIAQLNPSEPSTTGLSPSLAAGLSYLAGPFSGVVILLAEHTNTFVRFHAWQSIIGLGGLAAITIGLLFTAFLGLLITPVLFTALYWLAFASGAAWLALWGVCLVKAFGGHAWKMPVAGDHAAVRARRALTTNP